MKKLFFIAAAFVSFSAYTVLNATWKNDAAHSQLAFTVTHLGISDVYSTQSCGQEQIQAQR
jgi:polyisoprenoid-binding protein YceI